MNDFKVDTGGLRNEKPLTQEQINEAINFAVKLGMPRDKIQYEANQSMAYWASFDQLVIGTDLYPLENPEQNTKCANSRISWKGAVAHEVIGHRETIVKGYAQSNEIFDEAQASIRAAKFAPDLFEPERIALLRDAIYRLNKNGYKISEVRGLLHIIER